MSPNAPPKPPAESDYLAREIADARAALQGSLGDLKTSARQSIDLAAWAKAYPWPAVGAAAAAGFALAAFMHSRRRSTLADVASTSTSPPAAERSIQEEPQAAPRELKPPIFASLGPPLIDLAKLLIETVLVNAVRNYEAPPATAATQSPQDSEEQAAPPQY